MITNFPKEDKLSEYFLTDKSDFYFVGNISPIAFFSFVKGQKAHISEEKSKHTNLNWLLVDNRNETLEYFLKDFSSNQITVAKLDEKDKKYFIDNHESIKEDYHNFFQRFGNSGYLIIKRDNSFKSYDI